MNKKRLLRSALILVTALGVSALIARLQIEGYKATRTPATQTERAVAGAKIGGPFTLTDHQGNIFTEQSLAGRYALIYFGFTSCPAICPTELQKMTVALNQAGAAADKILPVFITVDPGRDTKEAMAGYVAQFHPRLVGLTGTPEQISAALKAYHIYARKVDDPALSEYTMDHSSYIYFIDPAGALLGIYGVDSRPSDLTAAIREAAGAEIQR